MFPGILTFTRYVKRASMSDRHEVRTNTPLLEAVLASRRAAKAKQSREPEPPSMRQADSITGTAGDSPGVPQPRPKTVPEYANGQEDAGGPVF